MIDKPNASNTLGLELGFSSIRGAELSYNKGTPTLVQIFDMPVDIDHNETSERASPLDLSSEGRNLYNLVEKNLLVTGLTTNEVLIRPLEVKLTKLKDVDAVLSFQAEPILPYSPEDAIIDRIVLGKDQEATHLTLITSKIETLENHLALWQSLHVEPEIVSCTPAAIAAFATHFYPSEKPYFILHLGLKETTCLLMDQNKLIAAFSTQTHWNRLLQVIQTENINIESLGNIDSQSKTKELIEKWCLEITKVFFSLAKQIKEEVTETLVTGDGASNTFVVSELLKKIQTTINTPKSTSEFAIPESKLQKYAVPIGLALSALPKYSDQINFRQEEFAYPNPWKRIKKPLISYFAGVLFLSLAFYLFGNTYLKYREDQIKQEYVSLIAFIHKPYEKFEAEYAQKFPSENANPKELAKDIKRLTQQGLENRLHLIEKSIQSQPESFPLQPNFPLVTDVLAWLRAHPKATMKNEETGLISPLIEVTSFHYTVVKRPEKNRQQEKYQVKVDLEFTSSSPKYAREFHDALIAPNDFIDPKSEVKWTASQGKYQTSFFLKDRTVYQATSKG